MQDPVELFSEAAVMQEVLAAYTEELAQATGGVAPKSAVKHLWRMLEKQGLDPEQATGDPVIIWDAARAIVQYDCMEAMARGLRVLHQHHKEGLIQVLRVKDRFSEPTEGGWADMLINLRFPSEYFGDALLPCEIQMVHSQMMLIRRNMGAHKKYAKFRCATEVLALHEAQSRDKAALPRSPAAHDEEDFPKPPLPVCPEPPPAPQHDFLPVLPGSLGN